MVQAKEYGLLRTGTDFYRLWVLGILCAMCFEISEDYGSLVGLAGMAHCAEPILRAVKKDVKDIKDKKDWVSLA